MANGTLAASQIEMLSLSGTGIITITPPATNTNRAITLPDAAGTVQVSGSPISGTTGTFTGALLVTSAAGLGYGTGAGGTVTQATNKGTAVTLNKPTGQVTTNNAALAAGATVSFSINNSIISATDVIVLAVTGGSSYTVQPQFVSGGVANIRLTNTTGGSLSEAVVINFAVIKGATS